ncbi:MAG: hypothetical protein U5R31_07330 [Acidimicrobiia bacterium]|nr:hypothetical protein [Acidimicrobiia bacterium]
MDLREDTEAAAPDIRRRLSTPRLLGLCLAVAAVSLAWPAALGYDPWAWLVWGREVTRLDLSTTGGPSWKPFPVLVTTPLALLGDLAPWLWMLLARAAGVLTVALAFRLARRVAGTAAGAVAGGLVLLTPDGGPRFLRLVLEGHGAPFGAALTLWAVERHLDGRPDHALLAGTGVALLRPEAWPFVGLYALWVLRDVPSRRVLAVACLVAIPLLWFGGDWWGSGNPWHGADAAQVASAPADRAPPPCPRPRREVRRGTGVARGRGRGRLGVAATPVDAGRARCRGRDVVRPGRRDDRGARLCRAEPVLPPRRGGALRAGRHRGGPGRRPRPPWPAPRRRRRRARGGVGPVRGAAGRRPGDPRRRDGPAPGAATGACRHRRRCRRTRCAHRLRARAPPMG